MDSALPLPEQGRPRSGPPRSGRFRALDERPVNLDGFVDEAPDLGFVAMHSPHDPPASLRIEDGVPVGGRHVREEAVGGGDAVGGGERGEVAVPRHEDVAHLHQAGELRGGEPVRRHARASPTICRGSPVS